jgi:N-acetylmuramoyl-L-alanine amidase
LSSVQFDAEQNRLEFRTESGVQPRAQLVMNPIRLVIDLPGISVGDVSLPRSDSDAIAAIRARQGEDGNAQIVVEMADGYTLNPQAIRFRGISPTEWTVQLPTPQRETAATPPASTTASSRTRSPNSSSARSPNPPSSSSRSPSTPPPIDDQPPEAATQIEEIRVTADGLFVRTRGAAVEDVEVSRSRNRSRVTIEIPNAMLSSQIRDREVEINQFGVEQMELEQTEDETPSVRLSFEVDPSASDWRANPSNLGGIVILPPRGAATIADNRAPSRSVTSRSTSQSGSSSSSQPEATEDEPAQIEGVELSEDGRRLIIQSDRPVSARGQWRSGLYQVTLSPAELDDDAKRSPDLPRNSPLLRVRLQEERDTVVISLQPASGVNFGGISLINDQQLALAIGRGQTSPVLPPSSADRPRLPNPDPDPPRRPTPSAPRPSIPNGRIVVAIDPGHGGRDPGSVGIGGLHEADIVLEVGQKVAEILEEEGIQAVLTRSSDVEIDLQPRVDTAEQANATLFVSIHANAIDLSRPDVNGIETYYYSSGEGLAEVLHGAVLQGTGARDRGIRSARFYVLRETSMPAVLVEIGFVTGSEDAAQLSRSSYRTQMARAIANGILQYVQRNRASTR